MTEKSGDARSTYSLSQNEIMTGTSMVPPSRQDSSGYDRHRISQLRSDALEVEEGGWAVVRPRHWWRKSVENLRRSPTRQQMDVKGPNTFKMKL